MMKRKILSLLLVFALILSLTVPAFATENDSADIALINAPVVSYEGKLVIIHTNDTHGRDVAGSGSLGTAAAAKLKADYEAMGAYVLLVNAGDAVQGTPLVNLELGAAAIDFIDAAGYDLMVPGNHEFDWGVRNFLDITADVSFPILAANILFAEGNELDGVAGDLLTGNASTVFEFGDHKIGVFGLTTPETITKAHPDMISGMVIAAGEELFAIAQAQIDALKEQGCDYIIAVGHLGSATESNGNRSIDVIENTEGIDLFVDAHSHDNIANGEMVGETLRVSAFEHLKAIGTVVIDLETGVAEAQLIYADGDVVLGLDEDIDALINERNEEVEEKLLTVIGYTDYLLDGSRPNIRVQETNLGNFATDAMLWAARGVYGEDGVDIAIQNGGSIRASIAEGDITMKDMVTVFPFNNMLVTLEVTGAQLLEALEAATFTSPEQVGAFPQVSGLSFYIFTGTEYAQGEPYGTYFLPADPGSRIRGVMVGDQPLDLEATYTVTTNDFTAAGGDTFGTFKGIAKMETGIAMEDALIDFMNELGVIGDEYAGTQGRITVVPDGNSADAWYFDAVNFVFNNNIMYGTDNGFDYDAVVTRAAVFHALYKMEGQPAVDTVASFADVPESAWYASSAAWANLVGLTDGTDIGYEGERAVTRQELAKIFSSYIDYLGAEQNPADITAFADFGNIDAWAIESFENLVGAGVITGSAGYLNPMATATRAQLAQMFHNLCTALAGE